MTQDTIKALSDAELAQAVAWGQQEQKARAERRKQETIAKIKELAGRLAYPLRSAERKGGQKKEMAAKRKG